jgi:hypothetical protein
MSHFAKVVDGFVSQVIVAEQDVIDSGLFGDGWIQTSYNTHGNQHSLGGTPLRGNFAANGYIYELNFESVKFPIISANFFNFYFIYPKMIMKIFFELL